MPPKKPISIEEKYGKYLFGETHDKPTAKNPEKDTKVERDLLFDVVLEYWHGGSSRTENDKRWTELMKIKKYYPHALKEGPYLYQYRGLELGTLLKKENFMKYQKFLGKRTLEGFKNITYKDKDEYDIKSFKTSMFSGWRLIHTEHRSLVLLGSYQMTYKPKSLAESWAVKVDVSDKFTQGEGIILRTKIPKNQMLFDPKKYDDDDEYETVRVSKNTIKCQVLINESLIIQMNHILNKRKNKAIIYGQPVKYLNSI